VEEARLSRLAIGAMAAAAAAAFAHALWIGVVTDDAGISIAYAQDLARGQGLRLTPLSPRVEAYSDPLWVLWLSIGDLLRLDGPRFAQWSGALCAALGAFLVGLVPSRAAGRAPRPLDAAGSWTLAFDTTYTFWAAAGLESGAFALSLSAALCLLARERGSWSALPAGLLAVLRPEGPLYVLLLAPLRARRPADLARWCALAALPVLAWIAFRRGYYGEWLPNSFFAKRRWDYGGLAYLKAWFLAAPWHYALLAAPLALLHRSTRRAALLGAAPCAAAAAFILFSRGDWMSEHRFAAHALPAAALLAGLVPAALGELAPRRAGQAAAAALLAAAAFGAWKRSPERRRDPPLPLRYIAEQAHWFRAAAARLGLTGYRLAHFDIGGMALESGAEVVDLAGLADLYIGRVGYQERSAVRDYLFDEVRPEMLNLHGPVQYLRDDPRLERDYLLVASGMWGENWVRKTLELDGLDDRCPVAGVLPVRRLAQEGKLAARLQESGPAAARDLWLCARAHLPPGALPDVKPLASRFAAQAEAEPDPRRARALLDAAVTLDPTRTAAAHRLLALRLGRAKSPSGR
jgi:hypothetical protein